LTNAWALDDNGAIKSGSFMMNGPAHQLTYGRYEIRVRVDEDPSSTRVGVVLLWNNDESAHAWMRATTTPGKPARVAMPGTRPALSGRHVEGVLHHRDPEGFRPTRASGTTSPSSGRRRDSRSSSTVAPKTHAHDPSEGLPAWRQRLSFPARRAGSDMGSAVMRMPLDHARIYALTSSVARGARPGHVEAEAARRVEGGREPQALRCAAYGGNSHARVESC
jgi:hypothetical protein